MKPNMKQLKECYLRVFDTDSGRAVMNDLERITNQTRISSDAPNSNSAIYKIAQQQLIQRIRNMMELNENKTNLTGDTYDE
tara:strand:+ start:2565 stop:2807 length:243 start_codon:yes stop_codon:yes gene_type:complete